MPDPPHATEAQRSATRPRRLAGTRSCNNGGVDAIGVALIGGLSGIGGAILGAWIGARAARDAARASQVEAQADREDARQARFADRIRDLAVSLAHEADRVLAGVQAEVRLRAGGYMPTDVSVQVDPGWDRWVRELRLVSRRPGTRKAADQLDVALGRVLAFAVQPRGGGSRAIPSNVNGWEAADAECWDALDAFEAAIHAELGVDQVG